MCFSLPKDKFITLFLCVIILLLYTNIISCSQTYGLIGFLVCMDCTVSGYKSNLHVHLYKFAHSYVLAKEA